MPKVPRGGQFWGNLLKIILIFLILISVYSFVVENQGKVEDVPLSLLANELNLGLVSKIVVKGDELEITYADGVEKKSKKEVNTALSETLANYGVTPESLSNVSVEIQGQTGFRFWLTTLAPFLIPLVFILFFLWFISRQVKGAGMQAFTFGQSKARVVDPNDKTQRVTFADVAGVKEAKEELTEIVDFLKNPKKFLD